MEEKKKKKSIFKRWWFWLLVAIVLVIAVSSGGDEENEVANEGNNDVKEETTENPSEDKKAEEDNEDKDGILTEEKFEQIKNGMTYEEVVEIIGSEGTVMSETGEKGTEFHTVMYEWQTDGLFSAANFMFQGGKLTNKSQMGVSETSDVTVTLEEFNKVANGMTYEEVTSIIGGEGTMISESGEKGTDLYTVMYDYKGEGDIGANANFMFQGGKLQNKSQFGLK